jgi:hypothetical protein
MLRYDEEELNPGKVTEDTLLDVFLSELRSKGLRTQAKPSYMTLLGRKTPDAIIKDGGEYLIEAEVGEKKIAEGVGQLYGYIQHIPSNGGFTVIFPEKLRAYAPLGTLREKMAAPEYTYLVMSFPKIEGIPPQQYRGPFTGVVNWVVRQVLQPPERAEYDVDLAVKVVKSIVESLREYMVGVAGDRLVEIFGGKSVFENVLQYEEEKYPLEEMRRAAGYLLVNQILFYQILSKADPQSYMEIDHEALRHPAELREIYFSKVLERDFTPTFGFDVASILTRKATETLSKLIGAIKALEPQKARQDILGQVFQRLIPYNVRKAVAAFYTNPNAAELLAELAIDKPEAEVMDLAVGSGTLLVAAYRRKRSLLEKLSGMFTEEDHKRFLEEQLTGIDVMPFAAHLAVVHLSLQGLRTTKDIPVFETEKVRSAIWDSTELEPDTIIPEISKELKRAYRGQRKLEDFEEGPLEMEYIKKGAITAEGVGGREIPLRKVDVIIMNPPFTRQERLPKEYKETLNARLKEYQDKLHGRLGLYGYFVFLADKFLKLGGKLALVLPASILRIASTQGIRNLLRDGYEFEYIITTYQRAAFSEEAQFREILLVARKTGEANEQPCAITFLRTLPKDMMAARELANRLRTLKGRLDAGETYDSVDMVVRNVSQHELRKNVENLFKFVACEDPRMPDIWDKVRKVAAEKLMPFSQTLTKLGGEIEEGARARSQLLRAPIGSTFIVCSLYRAIKRQDLWVVKDTTSKMLTAENLIDHRKVKIPRTSLEYGLRRFSGVDTIDLSEKLDFILIKDFPQIEAFFLGQNVDHILDDLPQWVEYIKRRLSKLVVACRFDMSATGTKLFAWYSKTPMAGYSLVLNITGLDDEDAKILALWFNSTMNALQIYIERIETRGAWMAFRKYVMSSLFVLDPSNLSDQERKTILKTFDEVRDVEFPSFLEQLEYGHPIRKKIDTVILKMVGFKREEIKNLLDYLYPALHKEISRLKELMAG